MTEQQRLLLRRMRFSIWNHRFLVTIVVVELAMVVMAFAGFAQADWWKAMELGIVEGITEFLPISSTGHLLVVSDLLNFHLSEQEQGTFEIFIQLGAVIAVVVYYARDLFDQGREILNHNRTTQRFWLAIFLAFLPAAIIGVLFHSWIKAVLFSPLIIATSLILGGIIFILIERLPSTTLRVQVRETTHITLRQAVGIGCVQVLAMIPGVSRSGASIIGGMLMGLDRKTATTFSFYLAIPTLGTATIFEFLSSIHALSVSDLGYLLLGMLVSLVTAWMSIDWLLRYVATNSFVAFGIYRISAGVIIAVLVMLNWIG